MPEELHADSYKFTVEKLIALVLVAVCLWFCFGGVARGYGLFGDFFGALKLGVCVLSFFLCIRVFPKGVQGPAALCALIGIIYNPFFKLDLDYDSWRAVNFVTAIAYTWVFWRFHIVSKLMTPELIEKVRKDEARARLAEARAEALNEAISQGKFDEEQSNEFMRKLTVAGVGPDSQSPSSTPSEDLRSTPTDKGKVIYFVLKGPPPGVSRTSQNTVATAAVSRIFEPDGTYKTTTTIYAGSDPLTILEASSVIYWRHQIENEHLTDQQVIEGLLTIQAHTQHNYIMMENQDTHPGEVAITSGLAQLSLHYAIAYLCQLNAKHPTVKWMTDQQAKRLSFDRINDFKKAASLKDALAHGAVAPEFLTHLKISVAGTKKEAEQAAT